MARHRPLSRRWKSMCMVALLPLCAHAAKGQSSAIPWYGVSGGFGVPASAHTRLPSTVGQSASGEARRGNLVVLLGFLGDTLFRPPVTAVSDDPDLPQSFGLHQNYPNPFNPETVIRYSVRVSGRATVTVHDLLGREVATLVNEEKSPGTYSVMWDAGDVASGVYFCRLLSGASLDVKRMVVLK